MTDETPRVYPCPLPECDFILASDPPGPMETEGALADVFGLGVMAATARHQRLQRTEQLLADHLNTHTVQEFAIALAHANKRIAELEASRG